MKNMETFIEFLRKNVQLPDCKDRNLKKTALARLKEEFNVPFSQPIFHLLFSFSFSFLTFAQGLNKLQKLLQSRLLRLNQASL